ncbi:MAG: maltose/maltodextrin ABC transporter substrate-binding protein MalE [Verrucomicrobia bacterium]|nr:maltose/maltodextrin ABC transporter substrate-binding protein MalE [Verrucomicrobiota bacterium]
MIRQLLLGVFALCSAAHAFAWTDGELLVWINGDKGYNGLAQVGDKFQKELGIPVKVEHPESLTDKFQAAAQSGKGPDIVFWAHDRLGEWAESGLLKPLDISDSFKANFISKSWDAVMHNGKAWGYPAALEAVTLVYNKKLVPGSPPAQLTDYPIFAKELKAKNPNAIPVMWDYATPYFSWPFLASAGAYPFKRTANGYDTNDIGVDNSGAIKGLQAIVGLITSGIMPKGASYSIMEQKMNSGDLATMVNGPWSWANLRKSGIDFGVAPVPGVSGNPGRPFVGVLTAMINRSSPNADLAVQFLEKYVLTSDGLKTIDADVPLGVPALKAVYEDLAAKNPLLEVTYQSVQNGDVMPNIPQMGKFWSSMASAFEIATNGQASPEAALADARKNMLK